MHHVKSIALAATLAAAACQAEAQIQAPLQTPAQPQQGKDNTPVLPEVQVSAPADESSEGQGWKPDQVLSGPTLRQGAAASLGESLGSQPGISSSGFGAASRPVVRGMDGARVQVMQNGMAVQDVSSLSPDHAVGASPASASQLEVVRGPAALLYGSGLLGGTVNVVNDRIPTELIGRAAGEAQLRASSVDRGKQGSFAVDGSGTGVGWHVDGSMLNANDYAIPGYRRAGDPSSSFGRLPQSWTHQQDAGAGASLIGNWGYAGASLSGFSQRYGVPTLSGAVIDQEQQRLDIDTLLKKPAAGLDSARLRLAYTDYHHTEFDLAQQPQTRFSNQAWDGRLDLQHAAVNGWNGRFGVQATQTAFSAIGVATGTPDTVQPTRSRSLAGFANEERSFGRATASLAARGELVTRDPDSAISRRFWLGSASAGLGWRLNAAHRIQASFTHTQRAPSAEELYSSGPHDATSTFDVGQPQLERETSRTFELALERNVGKLQWKAGVFQSHVANFIYGRLTGASVDEAGTAPGPFAVRQFSQADAKLYGLELEARYRPEIRGLSLRTFADATRGRFDAGGNLPLMPAARVGGELAYKRGPWDGSATVLHGFRQNQLASFETSPTPGWTRLDAALRYRTRIGKQEWTAFLQGRNLLNQDIRLANSLLKDVAPQPGRNLLLGLSTRF